MLCNHRLPERIAGYQISRWKALVGQEGITLVALGQLRHGRDYRKGSPSLSPRRDGGNNIEVTST